MSAIGATLLRRLTPGYASEMPQYDSARPHAVEDWDARYEQLKHASRAYHESGRLGWDDRLKLFHFSGPVDPEGVQYAWAYSSYNQIRIGLLLEGLYGQRRYAAPRNLSTDVDTRARQQSQPTAAEEPGDQGPAPHRGGPTLWS
nr:MAG: hypothetical protein [Guiyang Paspalum paspaloides tombus-like virus 1]